MDRNEQPFAGEYTTYSNYGNTGQIRVAQLAPQYQLLNQAESKSSIPHYVNWAPTRQTHPSSMNYAEESQGGSVQYHEFVNGRFHT